MPVEVDNLRQPDALATVNKSVTESSPTSREPIHILAIDDNEEFRTLIRELLEPHGFEVHGVGNPVKALEQFTREKEKFRLVFLDYYMPQLDGAKTFEWLKKLSPSVKVIIVSGAEELRLRQLLAQHAIDDYIRKPFRIQEALHVIRRVMGQRPSGPAVR
jgi:CheY-like chemotaxis protein